MSGPLGSSQWMYASGGFYPYDIEQSLRFNDNDSAYLSRTPASAGNRKTWTWSAWVKRGVLGGGQNLFGAGNTESNEANISFNGSGQIEYFDRTGGTTLDAYKLTTPVFRDVSAWYHLVISLDTTNPTAADRVKIYVNGSEITSFASSTDPALNYESYFSNNAIQYIGRRGFSGSYFDGYMAEVNFIDGSALDPTSFGEFKSGIWVPKEYTGSYGTNGFYLPFSDSAAIGDDLSGNANDWTPSGLASTDVMLDSPTNNYCTLNPIDTRTSGTLSDGNLVTTGNAAVTLRPTTGKWYYEKDGVGVDYDADVSGPFDPVLTSGTYNFGQSPFSGTPTAGHKLINTANLPAPAIDPAQDESPQDYFDISLWTGNGSSQDITGLTFQPDWVWYKERSSTSSHLLYDAIRGATTYLISASTDAEATNADTMTSFNTDGFSVGSNPASNENGQTYVGWSWLAGNGTSSNTDGTITSTVSVNQKAGFSIVSYTGTGANATVGHGLGAAPDVLIIKARNDTRDWAVYHSKNTAAPETDYLRLSTTDATADDATVWNDTAPTTSVFSLGSAFISNRSTYDYIAYCFAEVDGFSKFGSYTGNGSTDGPVIYCGFRPAFLMVKRTDAVSAWGILDVERDRFNPANNIVFPHLRDAEEADNSDWAWDFLSNGFKIRTSNANNNASGGTYIFMAFAEAPFKYANAR